MTMILAPDARAELACLMYHEVTDDPATSGFQRQAARHYVLTPRVFGEHLERLGHAAISPALIDRLDLAQAGRHLVLTFDDGGRSALYIAEQLAERGWQAHFFIVTSRIGERTFLDGAGIREIRALNHTVGTHSHTHPDIFRDLTRARMLEEWRVSALILEDLLGVTCDMASVPGGDISATVLESADDAGIRFLFTSEPWTTPRLVGKCWVLGRLCLKTGTSADQVADLVQFRGWRRARLERGLKGLARHGMAPLYRLYVERSTLPIPRRGA
jgi:peptidoglycan/xylan/chitin deacetylase (PgdA/CDA1 family)